MQDRYLELTSRDRMRSSDKERAALFHIIAGSDELYKHVDDLYNFKDHAIKLSCLRKPWLTSGTRGLIKLGFNLYNGSQKSTIYESFVYLDEKNTHLAIEAIKIRFLEEAS